MGRCKTIVRKGPARTWGGARYPGPIGIHPTE
jgi:hypothetical protein